jgi:hypothetical protein
MSIYKEMYYNLFKEVTKAIDILVEVQIKTEELFIEHAHNNSKIIDINEKLDALRRSHNAHK